MQEKALTDIPMHYCPGCGHTLLHKMICEIIDELGIREKTIGIAPVGCAVLAYDYWNFDVTEAAHGRCPAVATGIKRSLPDRIVFTYQGDGDLAAIGTSEIIHTANRGENITVIFVNNGVYGMTGGQLAPTTMIGEKTATTVRGRSVARDGYPLKIAEMISVLPGAKYIERVSTNNRPNVERTKQAIRKAFEMQINKKGFSMVEVITICSTYGAESIKSAYQKIEDEITKFYPLGILKDETD